MRWRSDLREVVKNSFADQIARDTVKAIQGWIDGNMARLGLMVMKSGCCRSV